MAKTLPSLFLLLGPETGLKEEKANAIIKYFKKHNKEQVDDFVFYPYDTDMRRIIDELANPSLFSSHKIIRIYNLEDFNAKDTGTIINALKSIDDTTLVLIYSVKTTADRKFVPLVDKDNKHIFYELSTAQKKSWLIKYFRDNERQASEGAIALLLSLIENTTEQMRRTCDLLIKNTAAGEVLEEETVTKLIEHTKGETVFSLFHKICSRDLPASLEILKMLLLSGETEAIGLFGGLFWQFKKLYGLSEVASNNYVSDKDLLLFDIRGRSNQSYYRKALQEYDIAEIEQAILLLKEFEIDLKVAKKERHYQILCYFLYILMSQNKTAMTDRDEILSERFAQEG